MPFLSAVEDIALYVVREFSLTLVNNHTLNGNSSAQILMKQHYQFSTIVH